MDWIRGGLPGLAAFPAAYYFEARDTF